MSLLALWSKKVPKMADFRFETPPRVTTIVIPPLALQVNKNKATFLKTREDVKKLNKKLKLKIENGKNVLVRL